MDIHTRAGGQSIVSDRLKHVIGGSRHLGSKIQRGKVFHSLQRSVNHLGFEKKNLEVVSIDGQVCCGLIGKWPRFSQIQFGPVAVLQFGGKMVTKIYT